MTIFSPNWGIEEQRESGRKHKARWRAQHPEEERNRGRLYRASHKEQGRIRNTNWRKNNQDKIRAEKLLQYHIRVGHIQRGAFCSICSATKGIESHHDDYSRPLDVIWVCRICHTNIHLGKLLVEEPKK